MRVPYAIITLAVFIAASAYAQDPLDGDELRRLLNPAEREHYEHSKEIKSDEMHLLLRKRPVKETPAAAPGRRAGKGDPNPGGDDSRPGEVTGKGQVNVVPQDQDGGVMPAGLEENNPQDRPADTGPPEEGNYIPPGEATASDSAGTIPHGGRGRKGRAPDRYTPPSWQAKSATTGVGGFQSYRPKKQKGPFFGIRMGTKIRAYLPQVTTNVEQNLAEIIIRQDVFGDFKVLPKDSKLFARKGLNPGTKKLELFPVKGITPQGEEFALKGIVLDINNAAGLVGAVSTDGKITQRSVAAGVFGVGKEIASSLNDGSVIGAGVEAAADNVLDEKETETGKTLNDPSYIIYVNPQDIKIRVEETF